MHAKLFVNKLTFSSRFKLNKIIFSCYDYWRKFFFIIINNLFCTHCYTFQAWLGLLLYLYICAVENLEISKFCVSKITAAYTDLDWKPVLISHQP